MMIHPGLAALNVHWDKDEYAAGYRACLTAIPDFDGAHHCWRVGWEDADTEMLELARHRKALAEGKEDDYADTWGPPIRRWRRCASERHPFDDDRTAPWKKGRAGISPSKAKDSRPRQQPPRGFGTIHVP
jgi:hypothetical protein